MTRTSDTDPIRVDFVDAEAHGLPGRLGLTFAPGKSGRGVYANWDRDLGKDLARLRQAYDTRVLGTLLEEFEMMRASISGLREAVRRKGMESIWFPIQDVSVPRSPEDTIPLVRKIIEHLAEGETVVVHCMGGLGRSGTIAACVLVARDVEPDRSIELVRATRPGAIGTGAQEAFVGRFREMWRDAPIIPADSAPGRRSRPAPRRRSASRGRRRPPR